MNLSTTPVVATEEPIARILDREAREDVAAALVEQGFSLCQAKDASIAARGGSFTELFKSALEFVGRARANGIEQARSSRREIKKNMETKSSAEEPKICRGYEKECDEPLDSKNRSGLCRRCYGRMHYHKKHGNKSTRKPAAARRARVQASKVIDRERVALEVTEAQLDRFLTKLPIETKQSLANHYLNNLDV